MASGFEQQLVIRGGCEPFDNYAGVFLHSL
jgi:hypothetical protein